MEKLKFYDLKNKKSFFSNKYKLISKKTKHGMRYFAVTIAPSGAQSYRIISKSLYLGNKR